MLMKSTDDLTPYLHCSYTAGIVGGLSTVAVCAPSEKFLNMGGPLAIGFGAVFAASLGSKFSAFILLSSRLIICSFIKKGMFLPPTTALGAGLHSIALYGGLV
jgi:hypothetical protein